MKELKTKVRKIVEKYAHDNPKEIDLMRTYMNNLRKSLDDKKLATATNEEGNEMALERQLYEIPETLFVLLLKKLTTEEQVMLKEKEMARWFAKEFPLFRVPEHV